MAELRSTDIIGRLSKIRNDLLATNVRIDNIEQNGGGGTSSGKEIYYIPSVPVNVTLYADQWDSSSYTVTISNEYKIPNGVGFGLPYNSSTANAQNVIKAALTISSCSNSYNRKNDKSTIKIVFAATEAPVEDIQVALFGLEPYTRATLNPVSWTYSDTNTSSYRDVYVYIEDRDESFLINSNTPEIYLKDSTVRIKLVGYSHDTTSASFSLTVKVDSTTVVTRTSTLADDATWYSSYFKVDEGSTIAITLTIKN